MIEPSKSPWACGVVMAKKKGGQLRFCCDFRYLNAVTIKDAYPIPRIDESLSKLGDAKFFTTLDLGSAFWQVPLRKQDREKTGFACELGLFQWKRMPFGLCSATATFQRLMAQALTSVTKKYGNLIMCYVDDVVIATPTLEDHIERLEEVFSCMKQAGLKCKPSKCEILRDSIKYLGRLVDKHGVRPDPEAVEAVLTWKAPKTDTQLMSFLGFANFYREFIKGYADKIYPMQRLMRNKGKKFTWTDEAQVSFENIKRELCEAPVLGMPTEKGMFVLDTDASVVATSGILHQEQEWNGRTVLRPIAYGSKVLSDTEMKYGAPKAEMLAVITFVEKYRAYLGSAPFKLRVGNRALAWLKTYSMDQSYIGRWIVRLDGYHMIIEHRTRDKHQNADSLSKKTEFYERLEDKQANQSEIKDGFSFLDKETYDKLPLTRWLDMSGHPIPGHPDLPVETAAEIKLLARGEPVPLDLLVRSNLVQQELTRLGINSMALLNRTVNVAPDVMGKLRDLLDREVDRHDHEWMETMQRLTVTERTEKRPVSIRSRGVERDCRSIVNQLVSSMPKEVLLRTSFTEYGTLNQNQTTEEVRIRSKSSFTRRVHFTDAKEEYEPSPDCSSVDETMSGESDTFEPVKDDSSEESDTFEPVQDDLSGERLTRPPRDRVLSGESRNLSDNLEYDVEESVDSSVDSRPQSWDNTSETTSNSDMSEIAIHSLLVDWKQRGLDRETDQDPDRDRYTSDEEGTVVDNAADELELIAVSKRPTRLLPHGTVVRTNLEPSVPEATPLKKIWCVKLMDDALAPEMMSGQMNVVKTYLKARYRLSDLLRAQRNDRMTSSLKRWIENGAPDKGDLEEDSYKILKQFYLKRNDLLYLNKDGIVACKRKEEDKVLYKYNSIVLPQLYQTELLFRSHDQMGHQGVDKVYNRIQKRFEWPGLKKACEKWIAACLSCQQAKDPRKLRFPLQSIESSGFNEVVQIDHQKICMTATGYNQVLVMIDHFTKYAEAAPCMTASAEETCDHLINVWIARHGCPITFQSDNGKAFVGDLTKELMKRSQVAQAHSTTYHPQTNGLVERQNRTLVSMLRVYCSRYMDDWDKHLPQVMGAYNSTEHSTTGISPNMMLTGHEKALPLTFFYPEYKGKRTAQQKYVRDVIRRQQDLNDLCRRNRRKLDKKRRFDKRTADAKAYSVGDYVWVFQEVVPPKGTKKLFKKWRGPFQITEVHQGGRFYRLSTGRAAHYENIKPHNASSEDWCIPADMQEGDYLIVDPACEVNERGTRDKNDGNEVVDECDLPLDLELTERVEVDDETLPYAEEDLDCPEQTEIDKRIQPDFPLTMETRQSKRGKNEKKYNPYGEDFVVDRIVVSDVMDSLVGLDEVAMLEEIDLVNDMDQDWIDDRSEPEVEFEPEAEQTHEQDLTNLRVLEWLHDLPTDPKETILTIQDVDKDGIKYISHDNTESNWVAPDGPLRVPQSNLDLLDFGRSTGTSMDIFVRGVGVGLTHTENLIIKKLKSARETGELETEGENAKKPPFGRIFESYFDLPNHYSNNIVITDSDFILTERTCAIAITADVSFNTALAADFKREYKNIEFLWKQRPGVGGMIALPPVASQIPGKYLCFLVTKATDGQHVDPKSLVLALTRLRDFLVERGVTSLSLQYTILIGESYIRESCTHLYM